MEKFKCILLIQEQEIKEMVLEYLRHFSVISVENTYETSIEAIGNIQTHAPNFIIFNADTLDIPLTDFMQMIRNQFIYTIALTTNPKNALKFLEDGVYDVLLSPPSLLSFSKKISKMLNFYSINDQLFNISDSDIVSSPKPQQLLYNNHIFLKQGRLKKMAIINDITYIENVGNVLKVYMESEEIETENFEYHQSTLTKFLQKLPQKQFIRINRSYIINCKKIDKIENQSVYIAQKEIKISRRYAAPFMKILEQL